MNVVFIAPPAAGKGTQATLLSDNYNFYHISTGDVLREIAETNTPLGCEIKALIDNGKLVSDELMAKLLKEKIGSLGSVEGIIFDGFPRTLEQAHMLDEILNEVGMKVNKVIYFDIDKDTAMKRALGRVTCKDCGEIYNTYFDTFLKEDECSKCGGKLEKRMDDTEEKFSNRFDIYLEKTKPLIDYYTNLNLLETVNCSDSKDNIFNKIKFIIEK